MKFRLLILILVMLTTHSAIAGSRLNINIGYGDVERELSALDSEFSALALSGDIQYNLSGFLIGFNFIKFYSAKKNDYGTAEDFYTGGPYIGVSLLKKIDIFVGYGFGRSKRDFTDYSSPLNNNRVQHDGWGPFWGARVYLLNLKYFEMGLGAQYSSLADSKYKQSSGISPLSEVNQDASTTGLAYFLVLSVHDWSFNGKK